MRLEKVNILTGKASIYAKSSERFIKKDDLPYTFPNGNIIKTLVEGSTIFCTDTFDLWMYQNDDTWSNGTDVR